MAKYLKLFKNQEEYEEYKNSGMILPNVSHCIQDVKIYFNQSTPPTPPTPSHDYVEIGGIKWATMNVGSTGITDDGFYFQWGDTQGYTASQVGGGEGQKAFTGYDYKYTLDAGQTFTKYNINDRKVTLDSSDDAVSAAWGCNWRMPTTDEFQVLMNAVNRTWTYNYEGSGVAGLICTDKTDSSKVLFFPAAGYANGGSVYQTRTGYYWSSSVYRYDYKFEKAYTISFSNGLNDWDLTAYRYYGHLVRGVLDE